MKRRWKKYIRYGPVVLVAGILFFIVEETVRLKNTGFGTKTLWDWMELLIIPLVLAGGAFYLNRSEHNTDREIAADRQKEQALQTYLDHMADLLLKEDLRNSENEEVRNVARTRTLTVLRGLDKKRKGVILKFLYEAGLIAKEKTIVILKGADLSGADLVFADLRGANLSGAYFWEADLTESDLRGANLRGTDFHEADLSHADLREANVSAADLEHADLSGATMPDGSKHD